MGFFFFQTSTAESEWDMSSLSCINKITFHKFCFIEVNSYARQVILVLRHEHSLIINQLVKTKLTPRTKVSFQNMDFSIS